MNTWTGNPQDLATNPKYCERYVPIGKPCSDCDKHADLEGESLNDRRTSIINKINELLEQL